MNLANCGKPIRIEALGQPHQCRPQPAMDIGHLAADETAYQYVGRLADGTRAQENLVPLGMPPPATANPLATMASARLGTLARADSRTTPLVFTKVKACLGVISEPRCRTWLFLN